MLVFNNQAGWTFYRQTDKLFTKIYHLNQSSFHYFSTVFNITVNFGQPSRDRGQNKSLDLFSSWPPSSCPWTQTLSPQQCFVAPLWDFAWGFPPALSVFWTSTTSPRTPDKLLHPGHRGLRLGPAHQPDPVSSSRHPGEWSGLPQDGAHIPRYTHTVCGTDRG